MAAAVDLVLRHAGPVRRMGDLLAHPRADHTMVISLWQGHFCTGTFR